MDDACERVRAVGVVFSGRGEGEFYVSIYARNFERALGFRPYPGTLNIRIRRGVSDLNDCLRRAARLVVEPPQIEGARLGLVDVYRARLLRGLDAWEVYIVRPRITHYREDVIEVISREYLRGEIGLDDGDEVMVEIECC